MELICIIILETYLFSDSGDIAICGNYYVNDSTFLDYYLVTFDGKVDTDTYRTEIRGKS